MGISGSLQLAHSQNPLLLSFYAKYVHPEKLSTPLSAPENCISANNGAEHELRRPSQLPPQLQNSVKVAVTAEISKLGVNFLTLNVYSKNNTNLSVSMSVEDTVSLWPNYCFHLILNSSASTVGSRIYSHPLLICFQICMITFFS